MTVESLCFSVFEILIKGSQNDTPLSHHSQKACDVNVFVPKWQPQASTSETERGTKAPYLPPVRRFWLRFNIVINCHRTAFQLMHLFVRDRKAIYFSSVASVLHAASRWAQRRPQFTWNVTHAAGDFFSFSELFCGLIISPLYHLKRPRPASPSSSTSNQGPLLHGRWRKKSVIYRNAAFSYLIWSFWSARPRAAVITNNNITTASLCHWCRARSFLLRRRT